MTSTRPSQLRRPTPPNLSANVALLFGCLGTACIGLGFSTGQVARTSAALVPVLGLCGLALGVVGICRSRSLGSGRAIAVIGLALSIGLLVVTVVFIVLVVSAVSHLGESG